MQAAAWEGRGRGTHSPSLRRGEDRRTECSQFNHSLSYSSSTWPARSGASASGSNAFAPLLLACNLGTAPTPSPVLVKKEGVRGSHGCRTRAHCPFIIYYLCWVPPKPPALDLEPRRETRRRHTAQAVLALPFPECHRSAKTWSAQYVPHAGLEGAGI